MKIINLLQGSDEWKDFRKSHITSTDSGVILKVNPWCSPLELWRLKLGLDHEIQVNEAMARGSLLEGHALKLLTKITGMKFEPCVCTHDELEWCATSLDGYDSEKKVIVEIKCPMKKAKHNATIKGYIPEYYQSQCQHHLYVTGADVCFFCSYFPGHEQEIAIIRVYPDFDYINRMVLAERDFYFNKLLAFEEPDEW